jgi:hypothetical protein
MKTTIMMMGLAGSLALAFAHAPPAAAQTGTQPADKVFGFSCEIDLSVIPGAPEEFRRLTFVTEDTEKNCTGSRSDQTIQMRCIHQIDGWTGGNVNVSNFQPPCMIWGGECGVPETFFEADNSQLSVSAGGLATLFCVRNKR